LTLALVHGSLMEGGTTRRISVKINKANGRRMYLNFKVEYNPDAMDVDVSRM